MDKFVLGFYSFATCSCQDVIFVLVLVVVVVCVCVCFFFYLVKMMIYQTNILKTKKKFQSSKLLLPFSTYPFLSFIS